MTGHLQASAVSAVVASCAMAFALLWGPPPPARAASGPHAVVANSGDNTVSVIDLRTGESAVCTDPSFSTPSAVTVLDNGRMAAVTNAGNDTISWVELNFPNPRVVGTMEFDGTPRAVASTRKLLLVSVDLPDDLSCVDGYDDGETCFGPSDCRGMCVDGYDDGEACTGIGDCRGTCVDGYDDGEACTDATDCRGTCDGGTYDLEACHTDVDCGGTCDGGPDDGNNCTSSANCQGECAGGFNDLDPCSSGADCAGICVGGPDDGNSCASGANCHGECSGGFNDLGPCSGAGDCAGICTGGPDDGAACAGVANCRGECSGGANDTDPCAGPADCAGICVGGADDGAACASGANCRGECSGGFNDLAPCAGAGDCAGICVGGADDGNSCTSGANCRGACSGGFNDLAPCAGAGDCAGICVGGPDDGASCASGANCRGACSGGFNDLAPCSGASDCHGVCVGGGDDGSQCNSGADCADGAPCQPGSCVASTCDPGTCNAASCSPGSCVASACAPGTCNAASCSPGSCMVTATCDPGTCNAASCDPGSCEVVATCDPGTCDPATCEPGSCTPTSCALGLCEAATACEGATSCDPGSCEIDFENDDAMAIVDTTCLPDCDPTKSGNQPPGDDALVDEPTFDGGVAPRGIGVSPGGKLAVVALANAEGVGYLDLQDPTVPDLLSDITEVGGNPVDVAIDVAQEAAVVADASGLTLSHVDLSGFPDDIAVSADDSTPLPAAPRALTGNGPVFFATDAVAHQVGAFAGMGLSYASGSVGTDVRAIASGKVGSTPKIAATDYASDTLALLDGSSLLVERVFPVGASPLGVAISPNNPPTARLSARTDRETANRVLFDASRSADSDGTIAAYLVAFGDGTSASFTTPTWTHVYPHEGRYSVSLSVTDDSGAYNKKPFVRRVTAIDPASHGTPSSRNIAPIARVSTQVDRQVPHRVVFDASRSSDADGHIVSYVVDFGDGTSVSLTTPSFSHVYPQAGRYTANVSVIDDGGASSKRPARGLVYLTE